jgi:hypothetical protein
MGVEDEGNAGRKGGGSFARPQMQCDCPFLGLKSSLVGKRYGGQAADIVVKRRRSMAY